MKIFATIILFAFVAIGCSTESPEPEAQLLTMDDLNTAPGYAWFPVESAVYSPNAEMVNQIRQEFDATQHKVLIYVKPSCGCRGTQRLFPQIVRTLEAAGVDMSRVEIWSMRAPSDKHKYMSKISVTELPTIYVMRNDEIKTLIRDVDYTNNNADSLIAMALGQ